MIGLSNRLSRPNVESLEEVATSGEVQRRFKPIREQHLETLEVIRRKAIFARGLVQLIWLTRATKDSINHSLLSIPDTTYTVALHAERSARRFLLAQTMVGTFPHSQHCKDLRTLWRRRPRSGRGHLTQPDEVENGRKIMREIVEELSQ